MSDISITPIPYNNGTLQNNHLQGHYVLLNPKMILHVNAQVSPNYVFAWVSTTTGNIKTGPVTWVAQPMRAILSFGAAYSTITHIRLWKLASDRALMLINSDLYVLDINASNDISVRSKLTFGVANILLGSSQLQYTGAQVGSAASNQFTGSYLTGWYVRDNVVWFSRRFQNGAAGFQGDNSAVGVEMWKVVFNPSTNALAATFMVRLWCPADPNVAINSYVRTTLVSIPNSTKKLIYVRSQNNATANSLLSLQASYAGAATFVTPQSGNMNPANMTPIALIDTVNDSVSGFGSNSVQNLAGPATTGGYIRVIVPLSETKWLCWFNSNQYRVVTANASNQTLVPSPVTSQIFPAPATATVPYHAEALDPNYFMLWSTSNNSTDSDLTTGSGNVPTHYVRIGKLIDNDIAQLQPGVGGGGQAITGVLYPVLDQEFIQKLDTDTFLMFGRAALGSTGSATPQIRVVYQPGG